MLAFATNRVHGLGLTAEEFWCATPREIAAHARLADDQRNFVQSLYAGLQTTLHNAHFRTKKEDPVFLPAMFMPDYQPEAKQESTGGVPAWKRDRDRMAVSLARKNAIQAPGAQNNVVMLDDRTRRAAAAAKNGYDRAVIDRIMQGLA